MNYALNIILIHTNYFKNILISDDYEIIINLSLLNKEYYRLINDVFRNYIFNEFPLFKSLKVDDFGFQSWINVYRFIFNSSIIDLHSKNPQFKIDIDRFLLKSHEKIKVPNFYSMTLLKVTKTYYLISPIYEKEFPHMCNNEINSIEICPKCNLEYNKSKVIKFIYSSDGVINQVFQKSYEPNFPWELAVFYKDKVQTKETLEIYLIIINEIRMLINDNKQGDLIQNFKVLNCQISSLALDFLSFVCVIYDLPSNMESIFTLIEKQNLLITNDSICFTMI